MSRTLSSATVAALLKQQTEQVFLILIEIDHADLASPIRLVNNNADVTSGGDDYTAAAFEFTPPVEVDGSIKPSTIAFDAVDRSIIEAVRSISSAPTVTAEIIRADAPDTIEAGPWVFYLRNVTYNMTGVSGELVPDNGLRNNFGTVSYKNTSFPGLFG